MQQTEVLRRLATKLHTLDNLYREQYTSVNNLTEKVQQTISDVSWEDVKIASRCYGEFLVYTESVTFSTFKAFLGILNEKADETGKACRQAAETLLLAKRKFDKLHAECGKTAKELQKQEKQCIKEAEDARAVHHFHSWDSPHGACRRIWSVGIASGPMDAIMDRCEREMSRAEEAKENLQQVRSFIAEDLSKAIQDLAEAFEGMADIFDTAGEHFKEVKGICKEASKRGQMHRPVFYQTYKHKVVELKDHLRDISKVAKRLERPPRS